MFLEKEEFIEVIKRTPLVSIDLIVRDKDRRVLLGQRTNEPAKGKWFVPGGRILKDMLIKDAFEGLLQAEVGMQVPFEDAHFLGVFEHLYDSNFAGVKGFGTHYVVLGYEITIDDAEIEILPCDQHSAWKWFTKEEVLSDGQVHTNTKEYFLSQKQVSLCALKKERLI